MISTLVMLVPVVIRRAQKIIIEKGTSIVLVQPDKYGLRSLIESGRKLIL